MPRSARLRRCAPLLLLFGLLASCGSEGEVGVTEPRIDVASAEAFRWEPSAGGPTVGVYINGASVGRVLLDTGRSFSLLSPPVADQQALHVSKASGAAGDAPRSAGPCSLRFGDVDVLDWNPRVEELSSAESRLGVVGVIGLDVLRRLEVCFDPFVQEVRVLPAGGVAAEMAAFAAEGWQVESLVLQPLTGNSLGLLARPVTLVTELSSASGTEDAVQQLRPPSPFLIALGESGSVCPSAFVTAADESEAPSAPATARLDVDGSVLQIGAAQISEQEPGRLGSDFLVRFLVGWDGPNRALYLADLPTLAHNR